MLGTIVLLLLCALTAIAGVPLILKLIPPNPVYGVPTKRALSRPDLWYEVSRFAGWALVAAAAVTVLTLILWSGTLLRPFWRQLLVFLILVGFAVGATLWHERRLGLNGPVGSSRRARRG